MEVDEKIAQLKEAFEAEGMPFIGEVADRTSGAGMAAVEEFEHEVARRGGIVKSVVFGVREIVFCGPNPTGAKFKHRLPRAKKAAA